jgi:N-acetylglucosamine-6-phosphate deacetylase
MIVLSGGELVLPDRIVSPGTLVVDEGRIVDIKSGAMQGAPAFAFHNHYIVPGFIDVHVHGVEGVDSLDGAAAVAAIAARLPRYGVTAFCPTTLASTPVTLVKTLEQIKHLRANPPGNAARVLPAHLESNFINPRFAGAQPAALLREPSEALARLAGVKDVRAENGEASDSATFAGTEILLAIERFSPDVGIVTLAPELDGGMVLVGWLGERGVRASIGHTGATYEQTLEAAGRGVRHATHLFNCMPPMHHRRPGAAGAVLASEEIAAELVGDGLHVHPAVLRAAIAAKGPSRVLAVTDGTAASGLPAGSPARIGGRAITAGPLGPCLDDGTLAGSAATMDRVFRVLVEQAGASLVDAAMMCSTTPARELGLVGHGVLTPGAAADLTILDSALTVVQTYVGGELVYARSHD